MMDLDMDEQEDWMALPHYGQDGSLVRPGARARSTAANISRAVMNVLLIGLILVILAIPISIGLTRLGSLNAQATPPVQVSGTPVPTAPVAGGFTGYAVPLFSLAYPSAWQHHATDESLPDGTPAHEDSFTDGQGTTAALYTTGGAVDLLAMHMDQLAINTAVNAPLKPTKLGAVHTYDGAKWLENDYTFSGVLNDKPMQMQMRVLGVVYGAAAYLFVLSAPQAAFGTINSADFEPLLTSFRFD